MGPAEKQATVPLADFDIYIYIYIQSETLPIPTNMTGHQVTRRIEPDFSTQLLQFLASSSPTSSPFYSITRIVAIIRGLIIISLADLRGQGTIGPFHWPTGRAASWKLRSAAHGSHGFFEAPRMSLRDLGATEERTDASSNSFSRLHQLSKTYGEN